MCQDYYKELFQSMNPKKEYFTDFILSPIKFFFRGFIFLPIKKYLKMVELLTIFTIKLYYFLLYVTINGIVVIFL